ncbi:MAG: hypothetical protein IJ912_02140 [Fibrobacter sp.]|nr:hypothetical protein [Fibrobacter sp.]
MDKKIHSRLNAQFIGLSFIICFVAAVLFACGGGDTSSSQDDGEASGTPVDSAEIIDDDAYDKIDIVPIENKTISGLAQKGPLKKGSTVTIIELDGETLEETGKKITGTVLSDSGNYSISDVSLVSQYAIVEAYGQYRDEVYNSGIYPTQLRALVDLSSREKVNVNIMTTFIYKRIFNLYDSGMNFPAAKKKAEKEFLREFGFTGDIGDFEDLDILKMGDGDAALLATSILFTRDIINPDPSDDKIWKTAFTEDFTTDGKWDDEELKTQMADEIDTVHFVYTKYNIFNWELSSDINHFEIFVNKFMGKAYGLGECTDIRSGEVKRIENTLTNTLYTHYICRDKKWYPATIKETDMFKVECSAKNLGAIYTKKGINDNNDSTDNRYYCSDSGWISVQDWSLDIPKDLLLNPNIQYGEMTDPRDGHVYKTVEIQGTTWMAQNLNYADSIRTISLLGESKCFRNDERYCNTFGRMYTYAALADSVRLYELYGCNFTNLGGCREAKDHIQGICPDGWRLPNEKEMSALLDLAQSDEDYEGPSKLKALGGWVYRYEDGFIHTNENGSDAFGFAALPTMFSADGSDHYFAAFFAGSSSTLSIPGSRRNYVSRYDGYWIYVDSYFSVRCIKDTAEPAE